MAKGTKKIDNWTVNHDGQTAEITVSIVRDPDDTSKPATFRAECSELNVRNHNPNIDELRTASIAAVKAALTREFAQFYYVQFGGHGREDDTYLSDTYEHGGNAAALVKINAEKLWLSVDASKDDPARNLVDRFKKGSQTGGATRWQKTIGKQSYHSGDTSALIPNTPENRAGLRRIFAGFAELNRQLAVLLDTESIESNLKVLAAPGGRLLNAGPAEPADITQA